MGEAATGVMRESVKRENLTHHALRITYLASRASLTARRFHSPCSSHSPCSRPSPSATDHYHDREVDYRFRLVKPYELDAAEVLRENRVCLMPLTPLMQGGVDVAVEAERAIVDSDLTEEAKADMLTNMTLMAGLVSKDLARHLLNRRRDLMIQSFGYELIKQEGLEEGLEKGLKEGFKQGFQEGLERGREEGRREGLLRGLAVALDVKFGIEGLKLMPELREIEDLGILEIIEQAIRTVKSPEELRQLYRR